MKIRYWEEIYDMANRTGIRWMMGGTGLTLLEDEDMGPVLQTPPFAELREQLAR